MINVYNERVEVGISFVIMDCLYRFNKLYEDLFFFVNVVEVEGIFFVRSLFVVELFFCKF